ncbi:PAS and ANTAR domain-containing protein [Cellulosimicrobium arenosum]|uniref:histidine kinase n=1 Tax=Cellulosimicrobium arenosum TaxID=2708133 RepID=A0A927IZQ8_9MICO|nr:PAS and ANTAR domain-containing protein [Cellulosimicrobium arenosum]MBD8078712.1 PAS and ANTAR domain-containing protein [Cellulosimicrobium arenosum]
MDALRSRAPHVGAASPAVTEAVRALVTLTSLPAGRFRYDVAEDSWWWSDAVYRMHGFEPGQVVPTTRLVLAHKHPDDRARAVSTVLHSVRAGEPFASMHRIVDASGLPRTLAVTGEARVDDGTGEVVQVVGYFTDVTEPSQETAREEASRSIRAADASRSTIEQAKGVLMVAYGVGADEAFELLRVRSNHSNVPVRELSRRLVGGLGTVGDVIGAARARVDALIDSVAVDSLAVEAPGDAAAPDRETGSRSV